MNWFFISRTRYEAERRLWQRLADAHEQRIRELEAERKDLWKKVFSCDEDIRSAPRVKLAPPAEPSSEGAATAEAAGGDAIVTDANGGSTKAPVARPSMRPSVIMRRQERLAQERWLRKMHPGKEVIST